MTQHEPRKSPQQQPSTWDVVAPTYAEDVGQWNTYAKEALRLVPVTRTDVVLDLAAGPGTLSFAVAGQAAHVHAVDFSPGMIEQVRMRAAREGVENVEATVTDATSLTFRSEFFDAAYCLFGFFFFPDRPRAFAELHRVLKPGGKALLATWSPIDRRPIMKVGFEAMAEVMPDAPRPAKGELQTVDECVAEMTAAGFHDVRTELVTASVRVASPRAYVDFLCRSAAPLALMKKNLPPQNWTEFVERMVTAVARRLPEAGGTDLTAEAILTRGER